MLHPLHYFIVDAFTTVSFKGNSAAVVILPSSDHIPDSTLQSIATEFNLAETAFVTPIDLDHGRFELRWFTPMVEFPLCGHATLATSSVIFAERTGVFKLPPEQTELRFETMSGILSARVLQDKRIELDLPAGEAFPIEESQKSSMDKIIQEAFQGSEIPKINYIGKGTGISFGQYLLVEVEGIDLEKAVVNSTTLSQLRPSIEVIIFTQLNPLNTTRHNILFHSRVFCPLETEPEDPVTGSAHCMLGPYWSGRLTQPEDKEMIGKQVSQRSGEVGIIWDRERSICQIRGNTVLVAKGKLYV
ncbi:hypothetical protein M422DRAFT_64233 [Sphaerobolus stellatus SS14]|nr:hypothetical protein M422DRAFT_64233 [Sphaerobolus stellatus SS14]